MAQRAAQTEPVQAAQGTLDKRGVFVKKATRNAAQFGRLWGFHQPRFYHTGGVSSFGCGSAALSLCVKEVIGGENVVTNPITGPQQFYRLKQ